MIHPAVAIKQRPAVRLENGGGSGIRQAGRYWLDLSDHWFVAGFIIHCLSMAVENLVPIKLSEFALLIVLIATWKSKDERNGDRLSIVTVIALCALCAWTIAADLVAGNPLGSIVKTAMRFPVLLLPIILFATTRQRGPAMKMVMGIYAALWGFFVVIALASIAGINTGYTMNESADSFKWIAPLPAVMFLLLATMRSLMSPGQTALWTFALATSFISALLTGSRTTVVMFLIGLVAIMLDKLASRIVPERVRSFVLTMFAIAFLFAPIVSAMVVSSDVIYGSELETPSNLERTFLVESGVRITLENPWFGIGSKKFFDYFAPWYAYLFPYTAEVDSAHNIIIDLGVGFGIPAAILFISIIVSLALSMLERARVRWIAIFGLTSVAVIYSVLPTAGGARLESNLLFLTAFFHSRWIIPASARKPYAGLPHAFISTVSKLKPKI
jgi:O-antigen ligase